MEKTENNNKLKGIIVLLAILLLASIAYMFKMNNDANQLESRITATETEKQAALRDLEQLKETYDKAIAENTSLSDELIVEREKVVKLMEEIKTVKGSPEQISRYKRQISDLQTKMNNLVRENEALKKMNQELAQTVDSTKTVLIESQEYNQVLVGQNEELSKTVEKASKLSIVNLKTSAFKVKNSGKEVATDRARRADILKINFTIAENQVAQQGDRTYYVQIIDANNNVLGEKQTINFENKSLTYSFITIVPYKNTTMNVSENLKAEDFDKGTYYVNIFDNQGVSVSNTSFTLK